MAFRDYSVGVNLIGHCQCLIAIRNAGGLTGADASTGIRTRRMNFVAGASVSFIVHAERRRTDVCRVRVARRGGGVAGLDWWG